VAARISMEGRQPFVDAVLAKVSYWRDLVQKVRY